MLKFTLQQSENRIITREKYNTSDLNRNRTKYVKDRTTQVHTYITKQRLSYLLIFFTNEQCRQQFLCLLCRYMFAGNEASLKKKPQKYIHLKKIQIMYLRDRPFNLKGGLWFFVSFGNFFFIYVMLHFTGMFAEQFFNLRCRRC